MKKIFIFTPIFKYQDLTVRRNQMLVRINSIHLVQYSEIIGQSVEHSKQMAYKQFLKTDCDFFLNIDADTYFFDDPRTNNPINRLVSLDKDVVGGLYVCKRKPYTPVYRPADLQNRWNADKKAPENYPFNIPHEPQQVAYVGGGFVLIKRKVIEELMEIYPVPNLPMIHPVTDEYLSEDYAFCHMAASHGFEVWVDPVVKLGHESTKYYTVEDYKNGNKS